MENCDCSSIMCSDPIMYDLIQKEKKRQETSIELIASENFTYPEVLQVNGSILTNKYSEGYPGKRYYGGNEFIDQIEQECINRALNLFELSSKEWGVNVQSYSGSIANQSAYLALLGTTGKKIMGLDLPSGGHLTHGYQVLSKNKEGNIQTKKISSTSIYYQSLSYGLNKDGYIDYNDLEKKAKEFKPNVIIAGYSAYPRKLDYKRFREIADKVNCYLMCDMAHFSGLVAGKQLESPFPYCDIVTTTTHKTLRGPRAGMIFFKKEFEERVNFAVFPQIQGGPHNNKIASIAITLKKANTREFQEYSKNVILNAKALANKLKSYNLKLISDGTDNHLILWDLKPLNISGSKMELLLDEIGITLNKNTVIGDKSALSPGGVRIGTPAMTTRGFKEKHFEIVGEMLYQSALKCQEIQKDIIDNGGSKKLSDFKKFINSNPDNCNSDNCNFIEWKKEMKKKVKNLLQEFTLTLQ